MKKYTRFFFVFMMFVLVLQTGCFKKSIDIDDVDWEKKIEADFLSDSSDIGEAIADAVSVRVEMEDDIISVIIKAPDIYDALVAWIENVMNGRFTEDELDEKIIELIEEIEPVKTTHTLTYEIDDDKVIVAYDKDFGNVINCGLDRFYEELDEKQEDGEWIILDDDSDRQNDTVDAQREKTEEKMTIELKWDGISGTGKLINLDIYLNGETEDGDYGEVVEPEGY